MFRRSFRQFAAAATVTPSFSRAFLKQHAELLRSEHAAVKTELALLEIQHDAIEKQVTRHLDHWAVGGLVYLVAQTGLLFHWVYFRFDWNLVEPITYLLGYSVVWLSIACFFRTGQEFSYDNIRNLVGDRKRQKLWRQQAAGGKSSLEKYVLLKNTEAELARQIAQLDSPAL